MESRGLNIDFAAPYLDGELDEYDKALVMCHIMKCLDEGRSFPERYGRDLGAQPSRPILIVPTMCDLSPQTHHRLS